MNALISNTNVFISTSMHSSRNQSLYQRPKPLTVSGECNQRNVAASLRRITRAEEELGENTLSPIHRPLHQPIIHSLTLYNLNSVDFSNRLKTVFASSPRNCW